LNYHWRVCREHQEAMEAYKDAKTSKPKFHLAIIKNETKNLALMKISYFLCQNALSFQKFPEISNLIFNQVLPMFGNETKNTYEFHNHYETKQMALQFVESINFILERSMIETIRRSDYFSILIDESMDISKHENYICSLL